MLVLLCKTGMRKRSRAHNQANPSALFSDSYVNEWYKTKQKKSQASYEHLLKERTNLKLEYQTFEKIKGGVVPRYLLLDKQDVCANLEALENEIDKHESGEYERRLETEYRKMKLSSAYNYNVEATTSKRKKVSITEISRNTTKKAQFSDVMDVTGQDFDQISENPDQVYLVNSSMCPHCDIQMVKQENNFICMKCNVVSFMIDDSNLSMAYTDDMEYSTFSYKRLNHLGEWLNQIQGREHVVLPEKLLNNIMEVLYEQGFRSSEQIEISDIRSALKQLKNRKYYENCVSILSALTGKKPPRLHPSVEEQIRIMFMSIQPAFQKHCPKSRRNFLSYSYILFKFLQLLSLDEYLPYFTLLKGADKLYKADRIYKLICQELDWQFIPSIS